MKLAALTSVASRHRYFVNRLHKACNVVAVAYEDVGYSPATVPSNGLTIEEQEIVANHFAERDQQEQRFFGDQSDFVASGSGCSVRMLGPGELNTDATLDFLESADVDTVAVFGTNLIKAPLLDRWPGRMINLHLGLSPYYRGTATNFFPLVNEEPEYVGATIHLLDSSIDGGPIFKHARPDIVADDRPHTIGCKAIEAGIEAMIKVLGSVGRGDAEPIPQWQVSNPRLYLRKDYDPRQVVELYRKLDDGLIARCLEEGKLADGRVRVID